MQEIKFHQCSDPIVRPAGFELASIEISVLDSLLLLFVGNREDPRRSSSEKRKQYTSSARKKSELPILEFLEINEWAEQRLELPPIGVSHPIIDKFPSGEIVVADSRCRWRSKDDFDLNAHIISPDQLSVNSILLGDGIERIGIDVENRIWVSYFDEGIFGNYGWGGPGPEPIGSSGLACFQADGDKVWEFRSPDSDSFIADCYALNVSKNHIYAYTYTEFPVHEITLDFRVSSNPTSVSGSHEFAVSGTKYLFGSQYNEPITTGHIIDVGKSNANDVRTVLFLLPRSQGGESGRLLARGKHFHYFVDDTWYKTDSWW